MVTVFSLHFFSHSGAGWGVRLFERRLIRVHEPDIEHRFPFIAFAHGLVGDGLSFTGQYFAQFNSRIIASRDSSPESGWPLQDDLTGQRIGGGVSPTPVMSNIGVGSTVGFATMGQKGFNFLR